MQQSLVFLNSCLSKTQAAKNDSAFYDANVFEKPRFRDLKYLMQSVDGALLLLFSNGI